MDNWKRKVEYSQYDSDVFSNTKKWNVTKEQPIKTGEINLSFWQLFVCTAKSILTRSHKFSPETAAFARSYMETIPFLLNEKDGFLAFDNNNRDVLRDFSKSTRIGEIAQGINYYFAKNYLRAYAVYDFKYYSKEYKKISPCCKGRTPDYVLCYPNNTIGIIESKGTMRADPTQYLITGFEQCKNGEAYLNSHGICVHNSYVSAVSFATSGNRYGRHTHIYLADPENDIPVEDEDINRNRLYEYSKWFYLAGNRDATEKLMNGKIISEKDIGLTDRKKEPEGIIIYTMSIEREIGKKPIKVMFGIKQSLMDCLMEGNMSEVEEYKHEISENKETFKDGTFIKIE